MTDSDAVPHRRTRAGGRAVRRAERTRTTVEQVSAITRRIPVFEVLDAEALQIIEHNAETILEEVGIDFRDDPEALAMWRDAGAEVDGERVRMPRGLARSLARTAPARFTQHARNPARSVEIGGAKTVFAPVYGPPFVHDLEGGRRYATLEDFRNFVKLAWLSPGLHHSGGTVCEPVDLPCKQAAFRHAVRSHAPERQADDGLGDGSRTGSGLRSRWSGCCSVPVRTRPARCWSA